MTTLPVDPVKAGALDLANRIVMAPLTRNRPPTPCLARWRWTIMRSAPAPAC